MGEQSSIEWTEATLNPWTGCTKVSPGCSRCYIDRSIPFRVAGRSFKRGDIPLEFHMERLEKMVRRKKPTMYFVNSLSDVFHEDASDGYIARLFGAMAIAEWHTFQVLTKRPERMRSLLTSEEFWLKVYDWATSYGKVTFSVQHSISERELPNVWLGVTIENRRFVERADVLRETPAAVRFISAEPLLGPLITDDGARRYHLWPDGKCDWEGLPQLNLKDIDWLIVGGESGPGFRSMDLEWVRDLRIACEIAGTAFFVKQLGGLRPGTALGDLPEDLRIREYPTSKVSA